MEGLTRFGATPSTQVTASSCPSVSANGSTESSLPMIRHVPAELISRILVPGLSSVASAMRASCLACIQAAFSFAPVHPARSRRSIRSREAFNASSDCNSSVRSSKTRACCSQAKTTCSRSVRAATATSRSFPQSWSVHMTSSKPWGLNLSGSYEILLSQLHRTSVLLVFIMWGYFFLASSL